MSRTREGEQVDERLWERFALFAIENDISTDEEDDWGAWWDAWNDGFDFGYYVGTNVTRAPSGEKEQT